MSFPFHSLFCHLFMKAFLVRLFAVSTGAYNALSVTRLTTHTHHFPTHRLLWLRPIYFPLSCESLTPLALNNTDFMGHSRLESASCLHNVDSSFSKSYDILV